MAEATYGGLPLTGERTLPGIWHENYWLRRHEIAYLTLMPLVHGAVVVDAGAGEGYGAARLALVAERVIAVDYDVASLRHLTGRYRGRVAALRANLVQLPLRSECADVVVALQVIEHLWDQPLFLAECARLLVPGGRLVVSTPNRLTFTPRGAPGNPFHTRELSAAELTGLLTARFTVESLRGVFHGPRLRLANRYFRHAGGHRHRGGLVAAQLGSPADRWPDTLRRVVTGVRAADFAVSARRIDASLDLLAVAVKR